MSFQDLSWLLIGMGVGIALGEENLFIFGFGLFLLSSGFIIQYASERQRKKEEIEEKLKKWKKKKDLSENKFKDLDE